MAKFRTRQAPSPTGYIHIGTARTVLFTDLIARYNKGQWYIRLEDTDRARLVPDAAVSMLSSLERVGLNADEGITLKEVGQKDNFYGVYQQGKYKPYIQSERLAIYHEHAQKLIDKGWAYWSLVSEAEKQDLLAVKQASKKPINYHLFAEKNTSETFMKMSVLEGLEHPDKPALRYKLQRESSVLCNDILLGETEFNLALEEDFVILKNDGFPTYHLAHLVDDNLMDTTLVIRSQEWYPSLAKHTQMFIDYWGEVPQYLHLPFILGETGTKKLSKRDMNVDLKYYLDQGNLPEAVINYLAFLGWNPGTEQELFLTQDEVLDYKGQERIELLQRNLSEDFSYDKLSKSPSRFSLEKLSWFNREYIKMLPLNEFVSRALELKVIERDPSQMKNWEFTSYLLDQNRAQNLLGLGDESDCVIMYNQPSDDVLTWKKLTINETKTCLKDIWEQVILPFYSSDAAQSILSEQKQLWEKAKNGTDPRQVNELFQHVTTVFELVLKDWLSTYQKDVGSYLWPLRVALSGKERSPSPFELLAILPFEEVQSRINSLIV